MGKQKPSGFDRLLSMLDADREQAGEHYEKLRARLVRFFVWQGFDTGEELADATLDRISKKLEEGEKIHDLVNYLYGVARNIVREEKLRLQKKRSTAAELSLQKTLPVTAAQLEEDRQAAIRLECLEHCLENLVPSERRLILAYYRKERSEKIMNRKDVAQHLNIPMNALRLRVYRIRLKLEKCIQECLLRLDQEK